MPVKCCWVIHGSWQADQRKRKVPLPHRHSSITRPSVLLLDRALMRQLLVCSCNRALDRLRTRRRVGLRAVEVIICMITLDFSVISMTSQASLSLLLLTKVTHAQYMKRYRASYNIWGKVRNRQFPAQASSSPGLSCLLLSALGAT